MPIGEICRHLGVARSSYYRWKTNRNKLTQKDFRDQQIGDLCKLHKFRYGYRKITELFKVISEKTVERVMQKYGWQCRVKVKQRKRTGQPFHFLCQPRAVLAPMLHPLLTMKIYVLKFLLLTYHFLPIISMCIKLILKIKKDSRGNLPLLSLLLIFICL